MKQYILLLAAALAIAQPNNNPVVDAKMRNELIENVLDRLNRSYVYPNAAHNMADTIHEHQHNGDYDGISSPIELARNLTADLQAISHDGHLHIEYSVDPLPESLSGPPSFHEAAKSFGFERLEHLPGNIGYLQLRDFNPDAITVKEVADGMTSLADSKALIIDLRYTGGGRPRMIQLVASYLFGAQRVHLDDLYWRTTDSIDPMWTLADLPGRRIPNADVYILTSRRTFSAPEAFAYDLQALKRATVVGEITGGGAHPTEWQRIDEHFAMTVPGGRSINPVTKTDWEYVGVRPDVAVSAEKALATANLMALRKIISHTPDQAVKARLERLIPDLEKASK